MSSPPKRIVPAVGVSCSRISFEVVVLPQPDSPISPSVSPGQTAKSTPSTALTQPSLRRSSVPVLTGKYFWTLCSSSSGADIFLLWLLVGEPAFRRPVGVDMPILGLPAHALRHGVGAAGMERTARRQLGKVRRVSRDRVERVFAAKLGHRPEQRPS